MYKLVETEDEQQLFTAIYKEAFSENSYELDDYYIGENRSDLVNNKYGEYAGTLQFAPYRPYTKQSTVNNAQLFLEAEDALQNIENVWDVDKITVKMEQRKHSTLDNIIETIKEVATKPEVTYLVGEINSIFCRALKIHSNIDVIKLRKIVRTKQYPYVPVVIPIRQELLAYEEKLSTKQSRFVGV